MERRILTVVVLGLVLLAEGAIGGDGKPVEHRSYAKVELKGRFVREPVLGGHLVPIIYVDREQAYELDLSKLKAAPKKDELLDLRGAAIVVEGTLTLPHVGGGTGGKQPNMPLVVVKKLMVVYE